MSEKHTIHSKALWAAISPEERSRRMSEVVKARWAKTGYKDRVRYSLKMVMAKKQKYG
jgi:hypothetical protein